MKSQRATTVQSPGKSAEPPELVEALKAAREWIADLMRRLAWSETDTALRALTAGLHALRDCLPREEATQLGLALPTLLRGFYFEGWRASGRKVSAKTRRGFLTHIHEGVHRDPGVDPEQVAHAVLALLAERLPDTEIENAKAATPAALHAFWPA